MVASRRRPVWWPENEPWPPPRRRRFARWASRRAILIGAAVFGALFLLNAISWVVFGDRREANGGDGPPPFVVVFFLLALAAGIFFTTRAARRAGKVGGVLDAVERLSAGDYSTRVEAEGSHDARELGRSFNRLAERLGALEEQRRNLVADVSHELRTPLSVIRGNLEGIADGVYAAEPERVQLLLGEVAVMARLVEDLQTLSLAEAGALRIHPEPGDLADLVERIVAAWQGRAASKEVALTAGAAPGPTFPFDAVRMREVLENLVANALRHTPAGGSVSVTLSWPFGAAEIEVADSGPGISAEDVPFIFERYRKAADSSGQGLGLAIARRLVEAHGGEVAVKATGPEGTVFLVRLPVRNG